MLLKRFLFLFLIFASCLCGSLIDAKRDASFQPQPQSTVETIDTSKEWKKLFKSRTNVLVAFTESGLPSMSKALWATLRQAHEQIQGEGSIVHVPCNAKDMKALCRKVGFLPSPGSETRAPRRADYLLVHFPTSETHALFDRQETTRSIVAFLRDPNAPAPWDEEADAVVHVVSGNTLGDVLRSSTLPVFVMFYYSTSCKNCRQIKPEFSGAAKQFKNSAVLAEVDISRPDNNVIGKVLKLPPQPIPTFLYFSGGEVKYQYAGKMTKADFIDFLTNPRPPPEQAGAQSKEQGASEGESASEESAHFPENGAASVLTEQTLKQLLSMAKSTAQAQDLDPSTQGEGGGTQGLPFFSLLLFVYTPWCEQCKPLIPRFVDAAQQLQEQKVNCLLSGLDASQSEEFVRQYRIRNLPTLMYFKRGMHIYDVNFQTTQEIVDFMKNPQPPEGTPDPASREESDTVSWQEAGDSAIVSLDRDNYASTLKPKRHSLVMFYAPWCSHCKQTKPEFSKASMVFSSMASHAADSRVSAAASRVLFGRVDCTDPAASSICEAESLTGYPTIKYYSYGKLIDEFDPRAYSRDLPGFLRFLFDHAREEQDLEPVAQEIRRIYDQSGQPPSEEASEPIVPEPPSAKEAPATPTQAASTQAPPSKSDEQVPEKAKPPVPPPQTPPPQAQTPPTQHVKDDKAPKPASESTSQQQASAPPSPQAASTLPKEQKDQKEQPKEGPTPPPKSAEPVTPSQKQPQQSSQSSSQSQATPPKSAEPSKDASKSTSTEGAKPPKTEL